MFSLLALSCVPKFMQVLHYCSHCSWSWSSYPCSWCCKRQADGKRMAVACNWNARSGRRRHLFQHAIGTRSRSIHHYHYLCRCPLLTRCKHATCKHATCNSLHSYSNVQWGALHCIAVPALLCPMPFLWFVKRVHCAASSPTAGLLLHSHPTMLYEEFCPPSFSSSLTLLPNSPTLLFGQILRDKKGSNVYSYLN